MNISLSGCIAIIVSSNVLWAVLADALSLSAFQVIAATLSTAVLFAVASGAVQQD